MVWILGKREMSGNRKAGLFERLRRIYRTQLLIVCPGEGQES